MQSSDPYNVSVWAEKLRKSKLAKVNKKTKRCKMTNELRLGLITTLTWMIANIDFQNQVDLTDDDKDL